MKSNVKSAWDYAREFVGAYGDNFSSFDEKFNFPILKVNQNQKKRLINLLYDIFNNCKENEEPSWIFTYIENDLWEVEGWNYESAVGSSKFVRSLFGNLKKNRIEKEDGIIFCINYGKKPVSWNTEPKDAEGVWLTAYSFKGKKASAICLPLA